MKDMRKCLFIALLCAVAQLTWADPVVVTTDEEIRAAVQSDKVPTTKYIYDGILYIERNGRIYDARGQLVN